MTSTSETLTQKVLSDDELNLAVGGSIFDDVGSFVDNAANTISNMVSDTVNTVSDTVTNLGFDNIVNFVEGFGEGVFGMTIGSDSIENDGRDKAIDAWQAMFGK